VGKGGTESDNFNDLTADATIAFSLNLALLWVSTLTLNNIQEWLFCKITKRALRVDYSLILDMILLCGIVLQFLDVPSLIEKYKLSNFTDLEMLEFNR